MPSTPAFFDVVTQMIDVVTNSAQTMPAHNALKFSWGEPCGSYIMYVKQMQKLGASGVYMNSSYVGVGGIY